MNSSVLLPLALATSLSCSPRPDDAGFDVVRVSDRGYLTSIPIYLADAKGLFAQQHLKLVYEQPPANSTQMLPLLERGELDVMPTTPAAAFYAAVVRGGKSRIVADRGHIAPTGCDYDGYLVRRGLFKTDSPTQNQLRGIRFSVGTSNMPAYLTEKYLSSRGLRLEEMKTQTMNETIEAQALESGALDGIHASEPHLSQLVAEGHRLIGPSRIYAPGAQFGVLIYGPNLTVKRRDIGLRFMKAYLLGIREVNRGLTPENIAILVKRTSLDPVAAKLVCLPAMNPDGAVNLESLLDFQNWVVRRKKLTRTTGLDAAVDMSFAQQAAKELGIQPSKR
jgi:NitT/TauT family transport system substrate-binding protein